MNRERRIESRPYAEIHKHPRPIKVEDRSPTPPPRVVSVGDFPPPPPPQKQKQMQKQSWQINRVQNQLSKQAKTSEPHTKSARAPKKPNNPTVDTLGTNVGQSSSAKPGSIMYEAGRKPNNVFGQRREGERGRLSP